MTGKQRLAAAMRHEPVDRVPVMCQLAIGHYLLNTDVTPVELWFTSEGYCRASVELARRYGFDGILVNLPGRDPNWMRWVDRIETAPDGGQTVYFVNGETAWCPADDNAHHQSRPRPTIQEVDPARLYYDDPHDCGGWKYPFYYGVEPPVDFRGGQSPFRSDQASLDARGENPDSPRVHHWPDYLFRTIELVKTAVGDELAVHGEIFSPFTQLLELFGYQEALTYLIDEPERCEAILAAYTEGAAALGVEQVRHGADAVLISSAFAGGGFISPRQYDRFVLPYEAEVVRRIHATGSPVYTHTCGRIGDRLERMADTGTDGIDTLDPPPLGNVELADAKRRVGQRVFFKGNLDAVNTLLKKSRDEVKADALARLAIGSPGGGYILSSACSVAPRVPPENLSVLVEASREFGPA